MVALHFPPWSASTGHLRVLSFCRHLPGHDWEPVVLTAHARAYAASETPLQDEPLNALRVYRAFALDAREHLSVGGKYPSWLALPDRWSSWWFGAVWKGLALIRELKPVLIFSTYPVATAHLVGLTLSRLTGLPWVADFRDPMVDSRFVDNTFEVRTRRWIERRTVEHCARALFTTDGARGEFIERYPHVPKSRFSTIPNGYEEAAFNEVEWNVGPICSSNDAPIRLVHSGSLYPDLRDPTALFRALGQLKQDGLLDAAHLRLIFRASGHESYIRNLALAENADDIVRFEPAIPHRDALREMLTSDGLVLLQAAAANHQIPAKIYEYLRARRPIVALIDRAGDTADLLTRAGVKSIAQFDDVNEIKETLVHFLRDLKANSWAFPAEAFVTGCSRASRSAEFAKILDSIA